MLKIECGSGSAFMQLISRCKAIHGETALHVAFAADREDCVRHLLAAGAKTDVLDRYSMNENKSYFFIFFSLGCRYKLLPMTMAGPSLSTVIDGVGIRRQQDFFA